MCFVSACCISAYTTLNFAIKSWLWSRKTSVLDASVTNTSDDAATIKVFLICICFHERYSCGKLGI